jgi:hypothetical protein
MVYKQAPFLCHNCFSFSQHSNYHSTARQGWWRGLCPPRERQNWENPPWGGKKSLLITRKQDQQYGEEVPEAATADGAVSRGCAPLALPRASRCMLWGKGERLINILFFQHHRFQSISKKCFFLMTALFLSSSPWNGSDFWDWKWVT